MAGETYRYNGNIHTYGGNTGEDRRSDSSNIRLIALIVMIAVLAAVCIVVYVLIKNTAKENLDLTGTYNQSSNSHGVVYIPNESAGVQGGTESETETDSGNYIPTITRPTALKLNHDNSKLITNINSKYAILVNTKTGEVIGSKGGKVRIYPASMTKIMTILVAYEYMLDFNIDVWNTYITMTREISDYIYKEGSSAAGFKPGEEVRLVDVFYGATLPSGGDAVLMLANYCYGGEKEFVEIMNLKANELGLRETHFVTSTGLHDDNHYTTVSEMAIITDYASKYPFLKELMKATRYTYGATNMSDERSVTSTLYNWRRTYNKNTDKSTFENCRAFGGKSGYTPQALYCLATFLETSNGDTYVVVTGMASNNKATVSDYMHIYNEYAINSNSLQITDFSGCILSVGKKFGSY